MLYWLAAGTTTCSYQVEIQTSDAEGAGTDAGVFEQIGGVRGETEALQLQAPGTTNSISARWVCTDAIPVQLGCPCLNAIVAF